MISGQISRTGHVVCTIHTMVECPISLLTTFTRNMLTLTYSLTFISWLIKPCFQQHVKCSLTYLTNTAVGVVWSLKSDRSNMRRTEIPQYSDTHSMVGVGVKMNLYFPWFKVNISHVSDHSFMFVTFVNVLTISTQEFSVNKHILSLLFRSIKWFVKFSECYWHLSRPRHYTFSDKL